MDVCGTIRLWRCAFEYLHFEGYSWLICDLIWQDISNGRNDTCGENKKQKTKKKEDAFLNVFIHVKWTNVIGRDEAEIRGVSSGKAQEAGELPPTGPLTGLACPGWESIHGSLLPVFLLPYIFKVMWKHKALWVWSLDQQSWALAGNWSDKFLGPMPDLLNQRLRVNSARVKGLKWWFSNRSVHPMHLEGLL